MCPFYSTPIFVNIPSENSCKSSVFGPSTVIFDLYLIPTKKKKARNRYPRGIQVDPGHKLCVRGKRSVAPKTVRGPPPRDSPTRKWFEFFDPGPHADHVANTATRALFIYILLAGCRFPFQIFGRETWNTKPHAHGHFYL